MDTQALIYALEKGDDTWLRFLESRLNAGFRLVLSEQILHEFAKTGVLQDALELTKRAVALEPLWLRSFADLEAEELCLFYASAPSKQIRKVEPVFVRTFREVSQLNEKYGLTAEEFVEFAFDPKAKDGLAELAKRHAEALNYLSRAVADGRLTEEVTAKVRRTKVSSLLSRGSDLVAPLDGANLDTAAKFCVKNHKWLMRECPAYATEHYLANYRTSNPDRNARVSDSMDLLLATAAFPYVSTFITNDGFLHGALTHVQKHLPHISTELLRRPPNAA